MRVLARGKGALFRNPAKGPETLWDPTLCALFMGAKIPGIRLLSHTGSGCQKRGRCRKLSFLPGVGRAHKPCAAALFSKHSEHRRCKMCDFDQKVWVYRQSDPVCVWYRIPGVRCFPNGTCLSYLMTTLLASTVSPSPLATALPSFTSSVMAVIPSSSTGLVV